MTPPDDERDELEPFDEPTIPLSEADRPDEPLFDGRYRILRLLGEGGFGKVYVVEDTLHENERLALKLVRPEHQDKGDFAKRFRNEIRVLRTMQHEGIPQIFNDGVTAEGEVYFTMAFVPGRSLEEVLREKRTLPPLVIANYVRQIVSILDYAHARGVVHRDLKPANVVIVGEDEGREQLKILDFGIAKILRKEGALEQAMTMQTQMPIGTPHYMAPEQVRGREVDGRTDLYALGIMIYRMVTGAYPFSGGTAMEILAARLQEDPTPLEKGAGPDWIVRLVRELLAREKEKRPTTARIEELLVQAIEERRDTNTLLRAMLGVGAVGVVAIVLAFWRPWASAEGGSATETARSAVEESGTRPGAEPAGPTERDGGGEAEPRNEEGAREPEADPGLSNTTPANDGSTTPGAASGDAASSSAEPGDTNAEPGAPPPAAEPPSTEPAAPVLPALVELEPAEGAVLPEGETEVEVSGLADRPLSGVTLDGEALELADAPTNRFTATIDYDRLARSGGELVLQLHGADGLAGEPIRRRFVLPDLRVPAGCRAQEDARYGSGGWASAVVNERSGIELLLVEGVPGAGSCYLGRTEVTWDQFRVFRQLDPPSAFEPGGDHPVVNVSFEDARAFCDWAGLRLPSAATWIFAGAGAAGSAYPWGDDWEPGRCNAAPEASGDPFDHTAPVDALDDLTPLGLRGMAGNVSEWCEQDGEPALLGGSWLDGAEGCQLTPRQGFLPRRGATHVGFRVALPVE